PAVVTRLTCGRVPNRRVRFGDRRAAHRSLVRPDRLFPLRRLLLRWGGPHRRIPRRFRPARRPSSCDRGGPMEDRLASQRPQLILVMGFALLGVVVLGCLFAPEAADAALRSAAGGSAGGAGGFERFVRFINRLADYVIPVGAAFSVLGLIWG